MFTNNYITYQRDIFENSDNVTGATKLVDAAGTQQNAFRMYFACTGIGGWMKKARCKEIVGYESSSTLNKDTYPGVYFGTGSTPANKSDYKLESPITSGLAITNPSALAWTEDGNGKYTVSADFVIRNTTEAEINIYEIGLFSPCSSNYNYTAPNNSMSVYYALMERTVLTEPITIPAGGTKMVTYKITFNQTLNVE